ncbi:MAG TPA: hypothetical protein VN711_00415 [Candidatus Saccharimonadales bacterium]|nr:hypothetical protein [Candidatus Saccharimonadales bacterium]
MIKFVVALVSLIIFFSMFHFSASAECQPIYGGGSSCTTATLSVIKTVLNPATNAFVHDMGVTDQLFQPGQTVTFHISVTNIGNQTAQNVVVDDVVPQFIGTTSPAINDGGGTTIAIPIGNLAPNQNQVVTVTQTISPTANFPANQSVVCLNNQAQVRDSAQDFSQDFSQFCVQTNVAPTGLTTVTPTPIPGTTTVTVTTPTPTQAVFPPPSASTLPPTGANPLSFLALLPTGLAGIYAKKIAEKMKKNSW